MAGKETNYEENLLNIILDEIDDIILIHDSKHTLVWINKAAMKKFNVSLDEVIGRGCYRLFGKRKSCDDCPMASNILGEKSRSIKTIPDTGEKFICTTVPLRQGGELKLVVQHLRHID